MGGSGAAWGSSKVNQVIFDKLLDDSFNMFLVGPGSIQEPSGTRKIGIIENPNMSSRGGSM